MSSLQMAWRSQQASDHAGRFQGRVSRAGGIALHGSAAASTMYYNAAYVYTKIRITF